MWRLLAVIDANEPCAHRYTDTWRHLHPEVDDQFTVWDEYTSARLSNEVRAAARSCESKWSLQPGGMASIHHYSSWSCCCHPDHKMLYWLRTLQC
jgi:hypothetical protein